MTRTLLMIMNNKTSAINDALTVNFSTRVIIDDPESNELFLDKSNAVHSQNMARAIARGLANEDNGIIHRIAFGNGGSFTDAGNNIILNPPNDGTRGEGWESRLYNETYSEIVDDSSSQVVGSDPGSVGPANVRVGGGAVPVEDDPQNSVISIEAGRKSNVIAAVTINRNEPISQLPASVGPGTISDPEETTFYFDELGFYTPGLGASSTPAIAQIDIGNENSDSLIPSSMQGQSYSINMKINGSDITCNLSIPSSGSGSGPSGEITYGDLCEGINTGAWLSNQDLIDNSTGIVVSITDISTQNSYPSITGSETFGYLVFQTRSTGPSATIESKCTSGSFFEAITNNNCSAISETDGVSNGVLNDPSDPDNERERLLTHITFSPILKKANRQIRIRYILTVSVAQVGDTVVDIVSPDV